MADQTKKAKINRKSNLGAFTRKHNHVKALVNGRAEKEVLDKQYDELSQAFKEVENAHQELCMHLDKDDDADESYLDEPSEKLSAIHVIISKAVTAANITATASSESATKEKEFQGSLANLKAGIESLGSPATNLSQLSNEKTISCVDMRAELEKIEATLF